MADVPKTDTAISRTAASVSFDPFTTAPARDENTTSRPCGWQRPTASFTATGDTALLTRPICTRIIIPITIGQLMHRDMACNNRGETVNQ